MRFPFEPFVLEPGPEINVAGHEGAG